MGWKPTGDRTEKHESSYPTHLAQAELCFWLTKTQYYWTEGLETKMTKEGDLIGFQRSVLKITRICNYSLTEVSKDFCN